MIEVRNGDILESGADIIVHQVNCMGAFGAGVAGQIRKKWPDVYEEYKKACDNHYDWPVALLGSAQFVSASPFTIVANCFGQLTYGRKNERYTDYMALSESLQTVRDYATPDCQTIAIPYGIGCGLGGGNWNIVERIIEKTFEDYKGKVVIYKYDH